MSQEISIEFKVEGVDAVNEAFSSIGEQASQCGGTVGAASSGMASSVEAFSTNAQASVDDVNQGFDRMASHVDQTSEAVVQDSENMTVSFRQVGYDIGTLGHAASGIGRLGEQFGLLNDAEVNALKTFGDVFSVAGSVIRVFGLLADASWAVTIAEGARTLATSIANSVASWGLGAPIMVAAAAAGAAAVAGALGLIPTHAEGGLITQPTLTWVGEKEPELIIPVSRLERIQESTIENLTYVTRVMDSRISHLESSQQSVTEKLTENVTDVTRWSTYTAHVMDSRISSLAEKVASIAERGTDITKGLVVFGPWGPMPVFKAQEGLLVSGPSLVLAGEKEPELIVPVSKYVSEFNTFIEDTALEITRSQEHVTESLVSYSSKLAENVVTGILKRQEEMAEFSTSFQSKDVGIYRKASPLEFLTGPLAGAKASESPTEIFTVQIVNPAFRSRSDLDYLIDRLKRMGLA